MILIYFLYENFVTKILQIYSFKPKFDILSMNNFCVKKYNNKIGEIAIKQAAINRLKFGPTSLTKL